MGWKNNLTVRGIGARRWIVVLRLFVSMIFLEIVSPMMAIAATDPECMHMGEELLEAKKASNETQAIDISQRIITECDSLALADLAGHFYKIGQIHLALATINGCVLMHPQDVVCWMEKGQQHVHTGQFEDAENAYEHAVALLDADKKTQLAVQGLLDDVHRLKRMREIFGR